MADPTDIAYENIALRTMAVKDIKDAISDRLQAFEAFAGFSFFNYIGSEESSDIVEGILELKSRNSLVLAYEGSDYAYEPMASRKFAVYIAVMQTKLYIKEFDVDPLANAVQAVIKALDKWSPGGHCRLKVTHDGTLGTSQSYSVAEITIEAEDQ